jgi:trans-2,3-dihydro-3-hydroxyanthranilate isomerase
MPDLDYIVCDVFTERPLAGNQLAVFTDGSGVSGDTMQALARETNYSETTFLLPPTKDADALVRIFTPGRELPFAGHPTLGTAFVLAAARGLTTVRLETGMGVIPVLFDRVSEGGGFGWMRQPIPQVSPYPAASALLDALGVRQSVLPVELYDLGIRHVFATLESPASVAALTPDFARIARLPGDAGVNAFAGSGTRWKTRMFAPGHGVDEDPATGSAAGPLALHLVRHGRIGYGEEIVIEQGVEVGRPSELHARIQGRGEHVESVEVGGGVVVVARGRFTLPNPS